MKKLEIGMDLGTTSVIVYVAGEGVVLTEPSVVVIDRQTKEIRDIGEAAYEMIGRTSDKYELVYPIRQGVIADPQVTEEMIRYLIRKGVGRRILRKPVICFSVPSGATEMERKALAQAAYKAGARQVSIIEAPMAAAIGAGIDVFRPRGNMTVDVGGGITDIAVTASGGTVVSTSMKVGGNTFDDAIMNYLRRNHGMLIGERTAEDMKIQVGCACPRPELITMDVKGRNLENGLPITVTVTSDQMLDALAEPVMSIVDEILSVLQRTPPELAADVSDRGIVLTGGGALLHGLDKLIEEKTGIVTVVAENPIRCVAHGTGRYLERHQER